MSTKTAPVSHLCQQAETLFSERQYAQATELYEQILSDHPDEISCYWYLGICQLLQGQEEEAQLTWMAPILEAESETQQEIWTDELISVLQSQAEQQELNETYEQAWLLRRHLQEIVPQDWDNLIQTLWLALKAERFFVDDELLPHITDGLKQLPLITDTTQGEHLLQIAQGLIELFASEDDFASEERSILAYLDACMPHLAHCGLSNQCIELMLQCIRTCNKTRNYRASLLLSDRFVPLVSNNLMVMLAIVKLLEGRNADARLRTLALLEQCLPLTTGLVDRIVVLNKLLTNWLAVNKDWYQVVEIYQDFKTEVQRFIDAQPSSRGKSDDLEDEPENTESIEPSVFVGSETDVAYLDELLWVGFPCFYLEDNPVTVRSLRNQLARVGQHCFQMLHPEPVQRYQQRTQQAKIHHSPTRPLKIGYLGETIRKHSVGWLCRWLLKHHDRQQFDVHLYSGKSEDDFIQTSLHRAYGDNFHFISGDASEIAEQIYEDGIDILIELDSITHTNCRVLALKPAPIQVHWLGYDASGIPGVDYFIADPYVLPENAQDYYRETIWRLPQTYIAVDGFEAHIPSLRRDQLDIPNDAVVFFCGQSGMKRNLDNARLHLRVIKEVPNSYLMIKSLAANPEYLEALFQQLADEEGVSVDRLRFLPNAPSEFVHRANLAIADVMLDTYPYNGATTTLEALWMGLPIVTRVGEQFAARNSYAMMMNVGITEGIAWNDDEYLEWAVRLGTDQHLRQDIFYRLQRSRHTSPLWNGQQFAHEMEKAYEEMWKRYV